MFQITVPAELAALEAVVEQLEAFFEEQDVAPGPANQLLLSLDEIFANVAMHAYPQDAAERAIRIAARAEDGAVTLTVCDGGQAFNPLDQPEPDTELSVEERPIGGLGIFLVRKLMDDVSYERRDGENRLTIVRRLS